MARKSVSVIVDLASDHGVVASDKNAKLGRELYVKVLNTLRGALKGTNKASIATMNVDSAQPRAASTTAACASVIATDTLVIGGATLTAVNSGATTEQFNKGASDIGCATNIAAKINDGLCAVSLTGFVEASNWAGSVTLATCLAGTQVVIHGHAFTAVPAATTLTSVGQNQDGNFSIVGTDTQDALALLTAINTHSVLSHYLVADQSSGVVTIRQRRGTAALGKILIRGVPGVKPSGATATTQFVATATVLISARHEGVTGNAIAVSAGGGTITVAASQLAAGTGGGSTVANVRHIMGSVGSANSAK